MNNPVVISGELDDDFVMNGTLLVDIRIPREVGSKAFRLTRRSG